MDSEGDLRTGMAILYTDAYDFEVQVTLMLAYLLKPYLWFFDPIQSNLTFSRMGTTREFLSFVAVGVRSASKVRGDFSLQSAGWAGFQFEI